MPPFPKVQAFLLSILSVYVLWYVPISAPVIALWHLYEPKVAAQLKAASPRLYAAICFVCHTTVQLVPLFKFAFMFLAGRPWPSSANPATAARKVPPALILLALAFVPLSCGTTVHSVSASGSVTASPTGDVTATIGVVLTFAQGADSALRPIVAADSQLTPAQQAAMQQALAIASDTLAIAQQALADYEAARATPQQCALVTALQDTVAARIHVLELLSDAGVHIPPEASAAIEGVSALVAALGPGCPTSGVPLATVHSRLRALR